TSPTNIGLALLSVLSAVDLDLLPRRKAVTLLGHMLESMEALEKWNGHLYNWYDTATAAPLAPKYVSTVDSGNLCGCLIALREGLYEWGEDRLARRAEALSDAMDLAVLYDPDRKLFTIGYDVTAQAYTEGWYDLMASEARQASFLAVARGEVSPRHWRRLSRALVSYANYSGMASWTGTMFEYFMPALLLPVYKNSLLYESMAFCLYVQRSRTARKGVPWGISESAFYAFDGALNYQYKAHGVQRLGLKRGLDSELVVSPYSSFLALTVAPAAASANLRRLRGLGMEGKYGLYEAADYTAGRLAGERPFEPVRCFMAHHLGMSLVSINNALNDNIMQRRFMRDRDMLAYRELLQEKVPVGAVTLKSPASEVPEKPKRAAAPSFVRTGSWREGEARAIHLVSNGAYTVQCDAAGESLSRMGTTTLAKSLTALAAGADGTGTPARFSHQFSNHAVWQSEGEGLTLTQTLRVPERENGEIREFELTWRGEGTWRGELACYLEPILAPIQDYEAHPAFSKLFLESAYTGDGVLFTRRPRRGDGSAALAVLWDAVSAQFDTSREIALGRGGVRALGRALGRGARSTAGTVLDPCLLARFPLTLLPGETRRVRLVLAADGRGEDAVETALRLLRLPQGGEETRLDRLLAACRMGGEEALLAFRLLDDLVHARQAGRQAAPAAFWPYGVSGDFPVAVRAVAERAQAEEALVWLRCHQLLTRCGFAFDLVFLLSEGGDYRRPVRDALQSALKEMEWGQKVGEKGGVHLLDGATPLWDLAAVRLGERRAPEPPEPRVPGLPFVLEDGVPLWETSPDGAFVFHTGPRLPPLSWSQMLCNEAFGWFVDETGGGHLWLGNAREDPLTPWSNDPLAIGGPEFFFLCAEGKKVSLFADADGLPCKVTYLPGCARWEKTWGGRTITTTAFVPMEEHARYLMLSIEGGGGTILHTVGEKGETRYEVERTAVLRTVPDDRGQGIRTELLPPDKAAAARPVLNRTVMAWNRQVSALKIYTPNQRMDDYINGWALYQVIACRLFGRTSRYQNGGAYGFRDQLQDVCTLIPTRPQLAAEQILRACARQFEEGDVQHWWHPPAGKGVRTRISDDLLWLPYTLCEYLETYWDETLLQKQVPYITSAPLGPQEHERYETPAVSERSGTVYEHAVAAITCVLNRGTGAHGLALMGTGDWNDGMDLVGAGGKGESVWLTWFLSHVLHRFAALCRRLGDDARAGEYQQKAKDLSHAANEAWDGAWFLRGYYDNGETLGSHQDLYCQIDSIAQSFGTLSPYADEEKVAQGVRAAAARLFHRDCGVVQLFDPPFEAGERDPGYIRGYLPGVRENGGQYTHGAVWLAMALLKIGAVREGYEILDALIPAGHAPEVYKTEPYVLPADVYYNHIHAGRGGWSWYTGAAGWYYRVVVQELLGIRVTDGRLTLSPRLPADWPGYSAQWRTESFTLHLKAERGEGSGLTLDGQPCPEGVLLATCTGEHTLCFTFG
ncbi:MAG: hypothetical protein GX585_05555, partial [Clostridiales bacterium]|nr:hypothetical protein [Clostridiales bacterium]